MQNGLRPSAACSENVAVGESAACGKADKFGKVRSAGKQISHMDVNRIKSGLHKRARHFILAVYALLSQNGNLRTDARIDIRGRNVLFRIKTHRKCKTAVMRVGNQIIFTVSAFRIVPHTGNLPANLGPGLLQIGSLFGENTLAFQVNIEIFFRNQVAKIHQSILKAFSFKRFHDFGRTPAGHLNHRAELFIKERFIERLAVFHKTVGNHFDTDMACEHHFAQRRR